MHGRVVEIKYKMFLEYMLNKNKIMKLYIDEELIIYQKPKIYKTFIYIKHLFIKLTSFNHLCVCVLQWSTNINPSLYVNILIVQINSNLNRWLNDRLFLHFFIFFQIQIAK